ncbi:hypothetical protein [Acetobacter garciniae]|uniref:hypothetical protein n=1 Tax=Acetobacter garciniae TaxID=2817435 RepID=UPI0038B3E803
MSPVLSKGAGHARRLALLSLCAVGSLSLGVGHAHAQQAMDHPPLTPARDAVIVYSFQPRPTEQDLKAGPAPTTPLPTRQVQVLYSGDGGLLRLNYLTGAADGASRGAVIINRAAQEVLVILNTRHIYTRLVQQESVRNPFLLDLSMQFTRKGTDTVAGQPCTVWQAYSAQGSTSACVTDDGFILRQDGADVDGLNGQLVATSVSYETVPSSAFQPPVGYQEVKPHAPVPAGGAGEEGQGPAAQPPASGEPGSNPSDTSQPDTSQQGNP